MNNFLKICVLVCLGGFSACAGGASGKQDDAVAIPAEPAAEAEGKAPGFDEVLGKEWKLTAVTMDSADIGFSREALGEDRSGFYTLRFDRDAESARIHGKAAPNSYNADFQQSDSAVSFGVIASTKMFAFNEPEFLREHEYFVYLQAVNLWALTDAGLELSGETADGRAFAMTFAAE
ncbi:MAG: META domain-containing protein [Spirochaetaceae bacterium]|jgi:hypothetical protein|nr:META domain-containing protein [Spirochaetaceae bacterium]